MKTTRFAAPLVVLCALALTACGGSADAPADPDQPAASAPASESTAEPGTTAAAAANGECPTVPQAGYELSSSDLFSQEPASGAVWGDGTLISWTFADGGEHIVGVDMSFVNDAGDAIPMSGIFLDDMGGGQVGSTLLVFDSETNGKPGFMTLTETEGTKTETLGVYCVTFKVAP